MSRSDLDAVTARRAALLGERARLDQTRDDLLQEDRELEVTERVLRRLGDLHYGEPALTPSEPVFTANGLHHLWERGLSGGRKALQLVRAAVERRTD
jgi:hypothetical protein